MNESQSIAERVSDVNLVEQMLERVATPDEAAATRRLLGIQREADRLSLAHSPEPAPPPPAGQDIDHLAHARAALERYIAWVESYPDDDPTPLRRRERAVRLGRLAVQRLEAR